MYNTFNILPCLGSFRGMNDSSTTALCLLLRGLVMCLIASGELTKSHPEYVLKICENNCSCCPFCCTTFWGGSWGIQSCEPLWSDYWSLGPIYWYCSVADWLVSSVSPTLSTKGRSWHTRSSRPEPEVNGFFHWYILNYLFSLIYFSNLRCVCL